MNTHGEFRTAVVPAAGLGTRFLPATKSVPKELLPVMATPAIEIVAAEAAAAGAERLVTVTSPEKEAVVAHFSRDHDLEKLLEARGKDDAAATVRRAPQLLRVENATQPEPLGLGHAVACAEPHLTEQDTAIAVLLPDDLVLPVGERGVLSRMADVRRRHGGTVLCAFEAAREDLSAYGVFDVADTDDPGVKRVRGMVEKPAPHEAPSTLACAGRYLLDREVFGPLREIGPGPRGEIDLTDAISVLIERGHPVHVVLHTGVRHDLGTPGGMLRAALDFTLRDPARGPALRSWLRDRIDDTEDERVAG